MGIKNTHKLGPLADVLTAQPAAALVMLDPMHGNTQIDTKTGYKTRRLKDIRREMVDATNRLHRHGVHVDGLHLEVSPDNITECTGQRPWFIGRNYQSVCDPNLNPQQAVSIVRDFVAVQKHMLDRKAMERARGTGWALD
jgi:3-deoxy-7-phosphoheptulonate synthase